MSYKTGFETGALTFDVNALILYIENTRELAEQRDKIWRQSGSERSPFYEFAKQCLNLYHKENPGENISLSSDQIEDFVNIYSGNYYNVWKYECGEETDPVLEVLRQCRVEGKVIKLPIGQLERSLYIEVRDKLINIGGRWKGGKTQGFQFDDDPSELLAEIAAGVNRNIKQEFQFFETPDDVADLIIDLAEIKPDDRVCEPEVGRAALIKAMRRKNKLNQVWAWELNEKLHPEILHFGTYINGTDFLIDDEQFHGFFDIIIANPPFSNFQDIDHIYQMYRYLKPGGRIVSVTSKSWTFNSNRKPTVFREWIESTGAKVHELESGAFRKSGTMVSSVIVVINKPVL